ncbi:MAG: hypothetical protein ACYTGW_19865 [Planctomycetota bacterium]|jgi:hypothetical protein
MTQEKVERAGSASTKSTGAGSPGAGAGSPGAIDERAEPRLDPGGTALAWLAGLSVFATVVVAAAAGSGWVLGEHTTPYGADLQVVRRQVPEAENGFRLLVLKTDDVYWPEGAAARKATRMLAGEWGYGAAELAVEILSRNTETLARFDQCLRRPQFQFPNSRSSSAWLPTSNEWRRLAWVVSLRAMARCHAGRGAGAVEEAMKLVRLGHRIEGAQGNLLHWNSGSRLKLQGVTCLTRLLPLVELSAEELVNVAAELQHYPANVAGLQDAYRWEYGVLHRLVDRLTTAHVEPRELGILVDPETAGDWNTPEQFDGEHTKKVLASGIRLAIKGLSNYEPGRLPGLFEKLARLRADTGKLTFNLVGVALCTRVLSKGILVPLRQVAKEDTYVAGLRTLLALKAWQVRNGELPGQLTELVPDFLNKVPTDPFDGGSLRYSRDKKIVYSVGEDQKDTGGSRASGTDQARVDDDEPTFHIGF